MGSPSLVSEPRRGAWLEIDLGALAHNVGVIRDLVGPRVAIAPVVKADAYGHGLAAVGTALDGTVEALCVATLDEGLQLREAGVHGRLVLLYPVPPRTLPDALEADIEVTLMSTADAEDLARAAQRHGGAGSGRPAVAHVAVETGFFRGGVTAGSAAGVVARLARTDGVRTGGLWSHLASPDDPEAAARQVNIFEQVGAAIRTADVDVPPRHLAATGGVFAGTAPRYEMVRPGLAVYGHLDRGLAPNEAGREAAAGLRPAMSLKARPVALSLVPVGGSVGYGGTWQANRPSRVATLPLGYGDGFARGSQPNAEALVQGRRVPIVGAISMDSVAVDVTEAPAVGVDDEFVLLGEQGDERISVADLAHSRNTIGWEVLSSMAARLDRVYHRSAG
jgi:alanine racemase